MKEEKGKKICSTSTFVSDARHMTIIWVLTVLTTYELAMTDEVKSKVNWVGHMHKWRCSMSRKYQYDDEEKMRKKLRMILFIYSMEFVIDRYIINY